MFQAENIGRLTVVTCTACCWTCAAPWPRLLLWMMERHACWAEIKKRPAQAERLALAEWIRSA